MHIFLPLSVSLSIYIYGYMDIYIYIYLYIYRKRDINNNVIDINIYFTKPVNTKMELFVPHV